MSKSFKDIATKKEKFYGVNYALSAVSEERIAAWKKVGHNADMALPPPNEFIPERFDILSPPVIVSCVWNEIWQHNLSDGFSPTRFCTLIYFQCSRKVFPLSSGKPNIHVCGTCKMWSINCQRPMLCLRYAGRLFYLYVKKFKISKIMFQKLYIKVDSS